MVRDLRAFLNKPYNSVMNGAKIPSMEVSATALDTVVDARRSRLTIKHRCQQPQQQ
jgi:hypothetical protein